MSEQKMKFEKYRPEKVNEAAWNILVGSWENGLSDREASFRLAKDAEATQFSAEEIHKLTKDYPEVGELRAMLLSDLLSSAKITVADSLRDGDIRTAKWYLERKAADEFSTKQAVAFEGAVIELSLEEKEKAAKEYIEKFENGE